MKLKNMSVLTLSTLLSIILLPASQAQDSAAADNEARQGFRRGAMMEGRMGGMRERMAPRQFRQLRQAAEPEQRLERLDSDGDGSISEEEFLAPQTQGLATLFDRRDRNGDGLLSAEESAPPERGPRAEGAGQRGGRNGQAQAAVQACLQAAGGDLPEARPEREDLLAAADSNGDGSLGLDELTTARTDQARQRFALLDSDGDGFVTTTELQAQQLTRQARRAELRACLQDARPN
jgi:Ca2+-binding EF-hand superfamily protein